MLKLGSTETHNPKKVTTLQRVYTETCVKLMNQFYFCAISAFFVEKSVFAVKLDREHPSYFLVCLCSKVCVTLTVAPVAFARRLKIRAP